MKKSILSALVIAIATASILTSCVESEKNLYDPFFKTPNPIGEGFAAPDGFDWLTMQNAQVTVEVNDKFQGTHHYRVDIYDANPIISQNAQLLTSGVAKEGEPLRTEISVEKSIKTIFIKEYTPTGLYTVRAADISADGTANCSFKSSAPSARSLAATRGLFTVKDPNTEDATLFPEECPSNVTEIFNGENAFVAGGSYKVTSKTQSINLGGKNNIKLYVTEDITLNGSPYLTPGSSLYILPGRKVIMTSCTNNGQNNCLISIGTNAILTVKGDIQTDGNYKFYNLGTIKAKNINCTSSSTLYNAGNIDVDVSLSATNSESIIINAGNITTNQVLVKGNSHIINRDSGIIEVENNTEINCNGGSWENDGKWTTNEMWVYGWNEFCINRCQLIVKDELKLTEVHLIVDGGGYVQCEELYMNNARVDLGGKSLFKVMQKAEYGYQTKEKGFKGTGTTDKALLVIKKAIAQYPNNNDIIHYAGNLQILCSDHPEAHISDNNYRWTLINGAEWTTDEKNTVSIPKTECNNGFNEGTTTPPTEPNYPITVDDKKKYSYVFEDQWPLYGDYDLNDVVMTIQNRSISIEKNKVKKFELTIDLDAVGATRKIGAAIMFDEVKASDIKKTITFNDINLLKNFRLNSFNIENRQSKAVVPLFDDAHLALGSTRYVPINTVPDNSNNTKDSKRITFTIEFEQPTLAASAFNINKMNLFIIVGGNKDIRREIHIAGYQPTQLAETNVFGSNNDDSSLAANRYYISKENLAWGIMTPTNFSWPLEYTNVQAAYPEFVDWVTSGGVKNENWWNNSIKDKIFPSNKN